MTTPAGWYDDGSGRHRWWDGTQWTEHFAPLAPEAPATETPATETTGADADLVTDVTGTDAGAVETAEAARDEAPYDAAAAETADAIGSVAAVESQSWNTPAPIDATATDEQGFTPPGATAATTPLGDSESPYGYAAPAYPGADASSPGAGAPEQPQQYQAAPGYPQAAPEYPQTNPGYPQNPSGYPGASAYAPPGPAYGAAGGYPAPYGAPAPVGPSRLSIVGLVGLSIAGLGTILSCVPATFIFGWILLAAGFIVSLISIFLKGKKWPGIAGVILSVVGTILAVIVAFVFWTTGIVQAVQDLPDAPPSSDSAPGTDEGTDPGTDGDTGPADVVEGEIGSPLTITQNSGTSEVTVNSATWATDDGSSIPSTNGGYVILDVTFTGVSGTSYINPFYFALETEEGAAGTYDYYVDGIVAEELAAGDTVSGKITFDVAESASYDLSFTDELLQEVARISFTPSAG